MSAVVNLHLMHAPDALRWRCHVATSVLRTAWVLYRLQSADAGVIQAAGEPAADFDAGDPVGAVALER